MNNMDMLMLRKIKAWAPSGANEFGIIEEEIVYIDNPGNEHQCKLWVDEEWNFHELIADSAYIKNRRSLADITTIIEQAEEVDKLNKEIELLYDMATASFSSQFIDSELKKVGAK